MGDVIRNFRDMRVYQRAFKLQQLIFESTKSFPREERYSLTDQIRRASRSIGANLAEAWQKRRYPAHFVSKLTDADGEQAETEHWIETAMACSYLSEAQGVAFLEHCRDIGGMLGNMLAQADSFSPSLVEREDS